MPGFLERSRGIGASYRTLRSPGTAPDAIITRYLMDAALESWEPVGPRSFLSLVTQGQVRYGATYGAITGEWKYTDYSSSMVTLRRVVTS